MKEKILAKIRQLEADNHIRVLLAVESGSRSWGFPSPDSDYDVRLVYVHVPEWYYGVSRQRDTMEYMSDDRLFDLSGWELRKTLQLMAKTNCSLSDWLFSDETYYMDPDFVKDIREVHDLYYNPLAATYHFASMAKNLHGVVDSAEEIPIKRFLYFMRAVLCAEYILLNACHPPINFIKMTEAMDISEDIKSQLRQLIEDKSRIDERCRVGIRAELKEFALERFERMGQSLENYQLNKKTLTSGFSTLDNLAIKYISKR